MTVTGATPKLELNSRNLWFLHLFVGFNGSWLCNLV